jgi:uncharacterized RDD family membrane protein YckC
VIESRGMFCPRCGKENEDTARFCQGCGSALQAGAAPTPVAPATPAAVTGAAVQYAGFWERLAAILIDFVIIGLAAGAITAGTAGIGVVLSFFAPWLYEAFMMSSEWQATVGKRVMSIVVTDINGKRLTFARATGRHFAKYISIALLGIGYIIAAFTERKQALHDLIAETLVIKGKSGNLP